MRNHLLQAPHDVVAHQVVATEVLTQGLVAKEVVVAKQVAALAVAPRMRLVRVARLSAEHVLGLRTRHISLVSNWHYKACGHIDENALCPHSVWKRWLTRVLLQTP